MTDKRSLADTIARAIANQIESSRSIIVQNMADVIHDALLLDAAKQDGRKWSTDRPKEVDAFQREWKERFDESERGKRLREIFGEPPLNRRTDPNWGSLENWWQDEVDYEARRGGEPWAI